MNDSGENSSSTAVAADPVDLIGRIVAVTGAHATVLLNPGQGGRYADFRPDSANPDDTPRDLQIGSLIKIPTADTLVFGMVARLSVADPGEEDGDEEIRLIELELVGEGTTSPGESSLVFLRGVSHSPTLGDPVYVATRDDLAQIYAQPNTDSAQVGAVFQDQMLPAYVAVDDLLGKHFALLGTTGCGKSCAIATILRSVLDQHREGHVLVLDLHGEYAHAFDDCSITLSHENLKLPYWLLNAEEIAEIIVERRPDRDMDRSILREAVVAAKMAFHGGQEAEARFSADSPVPYRMTELLRHIDIAMGKLDKPTDAVPYFRVRDRINTLRADKRFSFMLEERLNLTDDMVPILSQLFRIPADGRPVTVLDLSEVPSDVLNVVISLICRLTFDFALWSDRDTPVLLVCEEAHRYASQDETTGFLPTKRAISKIVNEGRKHGVSVAIVTQRPSEMALGILSQCNTIFAMRMSNIKDQEFVLGALSESSRGLIESLPSLRTGEAIAIGEGIAVPVRLQFTLLPEAQRPKSGTAAFSAAWKDGTRGKDYVAEIVERWRRQRRH